LFSGLESISAFQLYVMLLEDIFYKLLIFNLINKMGNSPLTGENAYKIKQTRENLLGEGSFGSVFKIIKKDTN
jgi:hypothetical protein